MRSSRLVLPAAALLAAFTLAGCALRRDPLAKPKAAELTAAAPDSFLVAFETSRGRIVVSAHRAWSPLGVDRLYYLVRHGFYDGARFFRVVPNFVAQFGLTGKPALDSAWEQRPIPDDPVRRSNVRGTLSFARGGLASRSAQLFFNLRNNARLDTLGPKGPNRRPIGFPPIARIVEGLPVMDSLYGGYGDEMRGGTGPKQDSIGVRGRAYLDEKFPKLDRILSARVIREWKTP